MNVFKIIIIFYMRVMADAVGEGDEIPRRHVRGSAVGRSADRVVSIRGILFL